MNKKYKVAIIGLGYVGLGLTVEFSKISKIVGFDKSNKRIIDLKNGKDTNLLFSIKELKKKSIKFSNSIEDLKNCNFFIICVPTPITKNKKPLLKPLIESSKLIGSILKKNNVVVYESTVYPGCTEEVCIPVLEEFPKLKLDKDFLCGYSPERINPGDKINRLSNIIKVVSGTSIKSTNIIASMYSKIIKAGIHKTPNVKTNPATIEQQLLPSDPHIALKAMIKTTESLIDFSDREAQALAKADMLNFAIMQDEKTVITDRYVQLSREFRTRLEEFRGADPGLLDRLEKLQIELGENAKHNNGIIDRLQNKSEKKATNALLEIQELSQNHKTDFVTKI